MPSRTPATGIVGAIQNSSKTPPKWPFSHHFGQRTVAINGQAYLFLSVSTMGVQGRDGQCFGALTYAFCMSLTTKTGWASSIWSALPTKTARLTFHVCPRNEFAWYLRLIAPNVDLKSPEDSDCSFSESSFRTQQTTPRHSFAGILNSF